jgi:hypothetical protein
MEKQLAKAISKAYKAFWTCRGTSGKTWGLKPKVMCLIYTAVVRPIVSYAATIWWPRVKLKASQAELSKLLRMAGLGITGEMRTAPTAAMEASMDFPHCTSKWKRRQGITDYVLMINGNLVSALVSTQQYSR